VLEQLRALGVPAMLSGSFASSLHGAPRATHDIDLVVDLQAAQASALVAAFPPPEFYLSQAAVDDAIRARSMFNLLSIDSGDKVDFWLLTDEPFDQSRFDRRIPVQLGELPVEVSTPEDTILMKLKWARDSGGSEKQLQDVRRVYELLRSLLDVGYIETWADQLAVQDFWNRVTKLDEPRV
jgi:hypothetical protein